MYNIAVCFKWKYLFVTGWSRIVHIICDLIILAWVLKGTVGPSISEGCGEELFKKLIVFLYYNFIRNNQNNKILLVENVILCPSLLYNVPQSYLFCTIK